MRASTYPQSTAARRIVADEARAIRLRLRASRMAVTKQLDEMARGARGVKLADQLCELADAMLAGPWSAQEAEEAAACLARRIVQSRRAA
jgi:hypothetical protein